MRRSSKIFIVFFFAAVTALQGRALAQRGGDRPVQVRLGAPITQEVQKSDGTDDLENRFEELERRSYDDTEVVFLKAAA